MRPLDRRGRKLTKFEESVLSMPWYTADRRRPATSGYSKASGTRCKSAVVIAGADIQAKSVCAGGNDGDEGTVADDGGRRRMSKEPPTERRSNRGSRITGARQGVRRDATKVARPERGRSRDSPRCWKCPGEGKTEGRERKKKRVRERREESGRGVRLRRRRTDRGSRRKEKR